MIKLLSFITLGLCRELEAVEKAFEEAMRDIESVTIGEDNIQSTGIVRDAFLAQNRFREQPQTFTRTIKRLYKRIKNKQLRREDGKKILTKEGKKAWNEAYLALQKQPKVSGLLWSPELAKAAKRRCNGREIDLGAWKGQIGESIAYGKSQGAYYMVRLYIDDGIEDRVHRTNMINPEFRQTGIAHCSHNDFEEMIVVLYANE